MVDFSPRVLDFTTLTDVPAKFIDSFCDISSVSKHFKGELGRFTPCFTDIVVLGAAHWADYISTILTWTLLTAAFIMELDSFVIRRSWLLRFTVCFLFAGELAKLRFVIKLTESPDYFFYLYCVYAGLQGWLALLALVAFPGGSGLELKYAPDGFDYVALDAGTGVGSDETCPEHRASIVSQLTFSWITPLMRTGYKNPLQFEDVWQLPPSDRMSALAPPFGRYWADEVKKSGGPSL
ncbi:hypothetical protein WJX73_001757, partial [Symbiochloris irregularis]